MYNQKSPVYTQKSPVDSQKSPMHVTWNHLTHPCNLCIYYTRSKEPCIHPKEPCIHSKEPNVFSKEPYQNAYTVVSPDSSLKYIHTIYIQSKEPCIHPKEPCIHSKEPNACIRTKSFMESSGCRPRPPETSRSRPRLTHCGTNQKCTLARS